MTLSRRTLESYGSLPPAFVNGEHVDGNGNVIPEDDTTYQQPVVAYPDPTRPDPNSGVTPDPTAAPPFTGDPANLGPTIPPEIGGLRYDPSPNMDIGGLKTDPQNQPGWSWSKEGGWQPQPSGPSTSPVSPSPIQPAWTTSPVGQPDPLTPPPFTGDPANLGPQQTFSPGGYRRLSPDWTPPTKPHRMPRRRISPPYLLS